MIDARERNGFIKSYSNVEQTEGKEEKHENKKKSSRNCNKCGC